MQSLPRGCSDGATDYQIDCAVSPVKTSRVALSRTSRYASSTMRGRPLESELVLLAMALGAVVAFGACARLEGLDAYAKVTCLGDSCADDGGFVGERSAPAPDSGICQGPNCGADAAVPSTCSDSVMNGTETSVDCGGVCPKGCAIGASCAASKDCDHAICSNLVCRPAPSCKALKDAFANAVSAPTSGVYTIDPQGGEGGAPYPVYCELSGDGGGWTLALKADGTKTTFAYDADLWRNKALLNPTLPDLDGQEAKLLSWNDVPFTQIRVGMASAGGTTQWLVLSQGSTSLHDLFSGGYTASTSGRDAWKGLLAGSSLQPNCNMEGFGVEPAPDPAGRVRLGILGNNEDDCTSSDSWLGIGGSGAGCNGAPPSTSVGNVAGCGADNGDVDIAAFGYVMVR
jgi:hypothetical protein